VVSLETVLAVLDEVRGEAVQAAEFPQQEYQTEFGFGRVAGILQAIRQVQDRLTMKIEAEARADGDDS